jgi:hypothetical protein
MSNVDAINEAAETAFRINESEDKLSTYNYTQTRLQYAFKSGATSKCSFK